MALAAIKAGKTETVDTPWGAALRTDYSHLLPEDFRRQGYRLGVDLMEDGSLLASQLLHPTDEFNHGTVELGIDPVDKYGAIGLASVNDEHQGKGVGKALYEAALAHGKNVLGLTRVGGGKHSSLASRVHQALARKHGLEYVPTKNIQGEGGFSRYRTEEEWADREDAPFDSKYADYEYTLKAEGALFKGAPKLEPEPEEDRFAVVHNISHGGLAHAHELGGLPAPSLAISSTKHGPPLGFGSVTLVGGPHLADPEMGVPVYDADIYSPRHPRAKYEIDNKKFHKLDAELSNHFKRVGSHSSELKDKLERYGPKNTISERDIAPALKLAYLNSKGIDVEDQMMDAPVRHPWVTAPSFQKFLAENPDILRRIDFNNEEVYSKISEAAKNAIHEHNWVNDAGEPVEDELREILVDRHMYNAFDQDKKRLQFGVADRLWESVANIGKRVRSKSATEKKVEEVFANMDEKDFERWAHDKLSDTVKRQYIPKGSRKIPYTLENIVKEMTRTIRGGEGFNYGLGSARAMGAKQFKSLDTIRQAAKKQILSREDFRAKKKEIDDRFFEVLDGLDFGDSWGAPDALASAIGESYKRGKNLARELREHGFKNVTSEQVHHVRNIAADLVNLPTEYFEAKPQRIVGINEFSGALVPHGVPQRVLDILSHHGVKNIVRYKDEAERKEALRRLVNEHKLQLNEKLDKMALADVKAGKQSQSDGWIWTDYSHLLPEGKRGHYSLKVRSHPSIKSEWHRAVISPVDVPYSKPVGDVTFATGIDNPKEMNIVASSLVSELRGQGIGLAAYEAALAHAKNKLGATHLVGDVHSSMASAVHRKLAAKHGLDYRPQLVDPSDTSPPDAYDDKYAEYSYALKSELKKDEEKPQEPVEPEMQPLDFYLGRTAGPEDITKAKETPHDPHLRALAARYTHYGKVDHIFDYLDDPHPLVKEIAMNSVSEGLIEGLPEAHEHPKVSLENINHAVDRVINGGGTRRNPYVNRPFLAAHPLFNVEHANKILDAVGTPKLTSDELRATLVHLPEGVPEHKVDAAINALWKGAYPQHDSLLQRETKNQAVFDALHKRNKYKDTNGNHPLYRVKHAREAVQKASNPEWQRNHFLGNGTSPLPEDLTIENLPKFAGNKFLGPEANAHLKKVFDSANDEDKKKMYALMANESPYNKELTSAIVEHYISEGVPHSSASGLLGRMEHSNLDDVREKIVDHILATPQDKEKHVELFGEFGQLGRLGAGVESPQIIKKLAKVAEIHPEVARSTLFSAAKLGTPPLEDMLSLLDANKESTDYDKDHFLGTWALNAPLSERKKLLVALDEGRASPLSAADAAMGLDDPGLLFSLKNPDVVRRALRPALYLKPPEEQRAFTRKALSEEGHVGAALIQEKLFLPEDIEEYLFKDGGVNQNLLSSFNEHSIEALSEDQRKRVLLDIVESHDPHSARTPLTFNPGALKGLLKDKLDEQTKAAVSSFMSRLIEEGPSPTGHNDEVIQGALEAKALSMRQIRQAENAGFKLKGTEEYFPNKAFSESVKFKVGTSKLREVRDKLEENPTKPTHKNNFKSLGIDLTPYTKPGTAFVDINKVKAAIAEGDKHHYNVSHDKYDEAQLHSGEASHVFQLNLTDELIEKLDEAGVLGTFRDMHESSRYSGHPIHEDHGIGWVRYTQASRPNHGPDNDCGDCGAKGHVECSSCNGDGTVTCHHCDGDVFNTVECYDCDGAGHHDDSGEEFACDTCDGDGRVNENCPTCDGDGTLACSSCHDSGFGEGRETCGACDGDGIIRDPHGPRSGRDHVFIDEIQSDFGQDFARQALASTRSELERRADENGLEGEEREEYIKANMEEAEKEAERFPPEHTKKINEILFGGMHSNEILAEAFAQWLRDNGHAGSDITMHSVDSKAPISLASELVKWIDKNNKTIDSEEAEGMSEEERAERGIKKVKNVPAHFLLTYDKLPRRLLGMRPSTYGEFPSETGGDEWEHLGNGAKTWHKRLRKMATVSTDIEKLAERYNPTVDGEAPVNHVPHMTAHPRSLSKEVKLYNEHIAGGSEPHFASRVGEGMDAKLLYRSRPKNPNAPVKHFIVKAYHDPGESAVNGLNLSKGWKEMTHQALYHAGGIGDLHQKVHVANHDYMGTKIPSVVIHVDHSSESTRGLEPSFTYRNLEGQRKKIHLMDFLTDNQDRHLDNLRYNPDKRRLLAIDHGDTFNYNYTDPFFHYVGDDTDFNTRAKLREHGAYDSALKWWAKNSDNIKAEFARHATLIRHPELRQRTHDAFMRRANLLDRVASEKKGNRAFGGQQWLDFDGFEDDR